MNNGAVVGGLVSVLGVMTEKGFVAPPKGTVVVAAGVGSLGVKL